MNVLLVGLSHKTAPVEVRECLSFSTTMLRSALTHFDATHSQAHLDNVKEGVILSTCNRLEIYALVRDPEVARDALVDFLSRSCELPTDAFTPYLYVYHNEEAVRHLMRVAAGLDSMVLGEPQILGQITEAYEMALSQRAARTVMSAMFRAAIHTGKRVRTETAISVNPASVSSVAANMAVRLMGDLSRQHVLLIGAGEMGAIAVKALRKRGAEHIVVANRTYERAEQLAKAWGGKAITFQQLSGAMAEADIIISSTGAPHTILNRRLLEPVMQTRPEHPLFIIDIAVPRDVDPNVTEIPNVYLCDIDGLQTQVDENLRERKSEIPRVEAIVAEEVEQFMEWLASLEVVSTITDLRQVVDEIREKELERLFNRLDLDERSRELIVAMSQRLSNKILHRPIVHLKKEAANGNGAVYIAATRALFALDSEPKIRIGGG